MLRHTRESGDPPRNAGCRNAHVEFGDLLTDRRELLKVRVYEFRISTDTRSHDLTKYV